MNQERFQTLCLYAFTQGVGLRRQTPNAPANTKTLFDGGMLYLPAAVAADPAFLDRVTALDPPDDIVLALGTRFPQFDAKAYLAARAEAKRLEEKAKKMPGRPS